MGHVAFFDGTCDFFQWDNVFTFGRGQARFWPGHDQCLAKMGRPLDQILTEPAYIFGAWDAKFMTDLGSRAGWEPGSG